MSDEIEKETRIENEEDFTELSSEDLEEVSGGAVPDTEMFQAAHPAGPLPLPYPNTSYISKTDQRTPDAKQTAADSDELLTKE